MSSTFYLTAKWCSNPSNFIQGVSCIASMGNRVSDVFGEDWEVISKIQKLIDEHQNFSLISSFGDIASAFYESSCDMTTVLYYHYFQGMDSETIQKNHINDNVLLDLSLDKWLVLRTIIVAAGIFSVGTSTLDIANKLGILQYSINPRLQSLTNALSLINKIASPVYAYSKNTEKMGHSPNLDNILEENQQEYQKLYKSFYEYEVIKWKLAVSRLVGTLAVDIVKNYVVNYEIYPCCSKIDHVTDFLLDGVSWVSTAITINQYIACGAKQEEIIEKGKEVRSCQHQ